MSLTSIESSNVVVIKAHGERADFTPLAERLRTWTLTEAYELSDLEVDADNVITRATVRWPDGGHGIYTATAATSKETASFRITYTASRRVVRQQAGALDESAVYFENVPELEVLLLTLPGFETSEALADAFNTSNEVSAVYATSNEVCEGVLNA